MKLLEIELPEYSVDSEPECEGIGKVIDDELKKHFLNKSVLVRAVASSEHENKTLDELIETIKETGTDRYNPARAGDRYENVDNKHIDLFAFHSELVPDSSVFGQAVWGFYHSSIAIHGYPMRIDIVIIYDAEQMEQVPHKYAGRNETKNDGFKFKDPKNKSAAVLGIIKIT